MWKSRLSALMLGCFIAFSQTLWAAETTPAGLWKTIDDTTNKPRSLIRITEHNGEYSAVVEKGLRRDRYWRQGVRQMHRRAQGPAHHRHDRC